jgi:hypothetical protein
MPMLFPAEISLRSIPAGDSRANFIRRRRN